MALSGEFSTLCKATSENPKYPICLKGKEEWNMKNYLCSYQMKERGYVEAKENEYKNKYVMEMKEFIDSLSPIIKSAKCGWDGVEYKLMRVENEYGSFVEAFMVLYCDGGKRWIPIDGNSKGCNFSVLGENLW